MAFVVNYQFTGRRVGVDEVCSQGRTNLFGMLAALNIIFQGRAIHEQRVVLQQTSGR